MDLKLFSKGQLIGIIEEKSHKISELGREIHKLNKIINDGKTTILYLSKWNFTLERSLMLAMERVKFFKHGISS